MCIRDRHARVTRRFVLSISVALSMAPCRLKAVTASDTLLHLDFAHPDESVHLHHGVQRSDRAGGVLEFTNATQFAEIEFPRKLDDAKAATIGGWFFLRRAGEQAILFRGTPEIGEN